MCTAQKLLGENKKDFLIGPLHTALAKGPDIPAPPPAPQEVKAPDTPGKTARRTTRNPTILTGGAGGVTSGALNTGATTLLGG